MLKSFGLGFASGAFAGVLIAMLLLRNCSGDKPLERIEDRFFSYVARTEGRSDLVLAKRVVQEKLVRDIRSDSPLAKLLSAVTGAEIGHARVELTCLVDYNYYVDLRSPSWEFELSGGELHVIPPSLELMTPPAFHSASVEARIKERSIFVHERKHLDEMRALLSDSLTSLGLRHQPGVRDTAVSRLVEILADFAGKLGEPVKAIRLKMPGISGEVIERKIP